ncbi:L-histidine N(alpha)-methyltransferase [Allosphingosinicella indica]|uniref:Dimethylhistidine N-methyltransferase n=1 Tax=Allosphingosinicella indica TaxID=941907 RepID=A0A1X7G6E0_9SPHN|nr:L-histidine N(alpha)-methyltransferase [Allosphingosinicella indica]SMF64818.1 dimethylhistidine N-methyltransferase [Allosphingosinicella indica]
MTADYSDSIGGAEASTADPAFRADVLAGLAAPIPAIPARWLYDRRGSELFEAITDLPEYYPTRTERALLEAHCGEVAAIAGTGDAVVEFGSGSSAKTPILLRAVEPGAYVPIDISGDFLRESADALAADFPGLDVLPVEGDFMRPIALPDAVADMCKLGFFPGSTIGNLVPRTAVDLLRAMRDTLGTNAYLLIGMDRIKDVTILVPAYDDAAGVTAEFNLNLLRRINAELNGNIPVEAFRHRAIWNDAKARIEMHLEAIEDVEFTIEGQRFAFARGDTIHTENSHKYGPRDARLLLHAAGWAVTKEWADADDQFALLLAHAEPPRVAP